MGLFQVLKLFIDQISEKKAQVLKFLNIVQVQIMMTLLVSNLLTHSQNLFWSSLNFVRLNGN